MEAPNFAMDDARMLNAFVFTGVAATGSAGELAVSSAAGSAGEAARRSVAPSGGAASSSEPENSDEESIVNTSEAEGLSRVKAFGID